jgi:hypothetical protein
MDSRLQVKRMLRCAKEEEVKLVQRRRSISLAESGGGISDEDELDSRARGLSRSLEASKHAAVHTASARAAHCWAFLGMETCKAWVCVHGVLCVSLSMCVFACTCDPVFERNGSQPEVCKSVCVRKCAWLCVRTYTCT